MASSPIFIMHLLALGTFFTGFSWVAVAALILTYVVRVFALTAGFHRYFSHRAFKTSRAFQFVLAWVGTSSAQLGPMWWAANHRHHHQHSDKEEDIHSPVVKDAFWAHIGWVLCRAYGSIQHDRIKDLTKYPELRFIDRFHVLPVLSLIVLLYALGAGLNAYFPGLGTSGLQLVMWGFFSEHCIGLPRHVLRKLGHAHSRLEALCERRREPQQLVGRTADFRRGLAQQSPPLAALRSPGYVLVGVGYFLLGAACPRKNGLGLGPQNISG